ncbi:alpha/beta hydrolase [Roseiflexus sp.]|uniref:alpha/beta hydrolase n=1 Tax=Roseiflexus sp. TaxID=2562120 RepID=UPI00398BBC22
MKESVKPVAALLIILLLTATALLTATPVRAASPAGVFQPSACMFELPVGAVEGRDLECGWLQVPERHAQPDGPTIRLAVAIIKSRASNPKPDPLVMLQGGPGGSTIDTYTQILFASGSRLRDMLDHDIILFDQRGALYAEPSLVCQEQLELVERTIEQRLTYEESNQLSLEAAAACRQRLADERIDLSAFNSVENAADVAALARALGYEKINLYGVSYGTLLAQHVMRDHPDILRSVVLDAVVPTSVNYLVEAPRSQDRAYTELFNACAADAGCQAAYPNLEQSLITTIERLNREPARIPITDDETGRTYNAVLDGDSFANVIFQIMYASSFIPAVPRIIDDATRNNFRVLERVLPIIVFDRTFSLGMHYSVICAEDADFSPEDAPIQEVRPFIALDGRRGLEGYLERCNIWQVDQLEPVVDAPVVSDIPTLVLSGRFDPITPPEFGDIAARTLSRAYVYTFPDIGHGAVSASACADAILKAFLDNPAQRPDSSCIVESAGPRFISPATVIFTPTTFALATLDAAGLAPLSAFVGGLFLLLSAWVIWPLAWLFRRITGKQAPETSVGATTARWLVVLAGVAGVAFVVMTVATIVQLAIANDATIFYGLPRSATLVATIWTIPASTLAILVCVALSWARQWWSGIGRVYYSLLGLSAIVCTASLAWMGMLRV